MDVDTIAQALDRGRSIALNRHYYQLTITVINQSIREGCNCMTAQAVQHSHTAAHMVTAIPSNSLFQCSMVESGTAMRKGPRICSTSKRWSKKVTTCTVLPRPRKMGADGTG
jgi:hypothetical protein